MNRSDYISGYSKPKKKPRPVHFKDGYSYHIRTACMKPLKKANGKRNVLARYQGSLVTCKACLRYMNE